MRMARDLPWQSLCLRQKRQKINAKYTNKQMRISNSKQCWEKIKQSERVENHWGSNKGEWIEKNSMRQLRLS